MRPKSVIEVYGWVALIGATSLGWDGIYMAELARCEVSADIFSSRLPERDRSLCMQYRRMT